MCFFKLSNGLFKFFQPITNVTDKSHNFVLLSRPASLPAEITYLQPLIFDLLPTEGDIYVNKDGKSYTTTATTTSAPTSATTPSAPTSSNRTKLHVETTLYKLLNLTVTLIDGDSPSFYFCGMPSPDSQRLFSPFINYDGLN